MSENNWMFVDDEEDSCPEDCDKSNEGTSEGDSENTVGDTSDAIDEIVGDPPIIIQGPGNLDGYTFTGKKTFPKSDSKDEEADGD